MHQVVFRSNGDVQFKDRGVPAEALNECGGASEPAGGAAEPADRNSTRSFFGLRMLSPLKKTVLRCYEVALKASSAADYYMTKYQSKAQRVLSTAMGPVTAGMRRFEEAAEQKKTSGTEPSGKTCLVSLAKAKLRRLTFSANRSHWYSACELVIYVLTGGHCIQTHRSKEIFLG